jgi:hypothetical protein
MDIFPEDLHTFMIVSGGTVCRMGNISEQRCRENQNTHLVFYNVCPKIVILYEVMWKYIVEPVMPQIQYAAHALCKLDN